MCALSLSLSDYTSLALDLQRNFRVFADLVGQTKSYNDEPITHIE